MFRFPKIEYFILYDHIQT